MLEFGSWMPLRLSSLRQATSGRIYPGFHLNYSSPRTRWKRFSHIRPLHSGSGDVPEGQGQTKLQENGWEPWPDTKNWTTAGADQVDDKNIVIGDLNATLDAHRTANRLRKITLPEDVPPLHLGFRRPDLSGQKDVETGTGAVEGRFHMIRKGALKAIHATTKEGKVSRKIKWPVPKAVHARIDEGKVRIRKIQGNTQILVQNLGYVEPGKGKQRNQVRPIKFKNLGDYKGIGFQPRGSWELKKKPYDHSPWLDRIARPAIPGIERLVWRPKISEGVLIKSEQVVHGDN